MKSLGLYLHIPFCRSKCFYCDFCSFPHPKEETVAQYVHRLCEDLTAQASRCREHAVDTVYLGGGTPSILPAEALIRVLETVKEQYRVTTDAEITLECNPATADAADFKALRKAGFNRVSLGLQSAHDAELKQLGRRHSFADFCNTVTDLRRAGFDNLSADVMFGLPGQSADSYLQTLERLIALSPEHISAYGLTVEEGTPFGVLQSRGQLTLPDEEETERMYFEGIQLLAANGYAQYEISNFSKKGYESRHNLKYWSSEEYLGFGPAAYSDFAGDRFGNSRDMRTYLDGGDILAERERPDERERENEYVMLRMRLCDGVSAADFRARFGKDLETYFGEGLSRYLDGGFVQRRGDGYAFTPKGMYVSNTILSDVLEF